MKVVDKFLNKGEEIVFDELSSIASDEALRVFAKPRVSDVLLKGRTRLDERTFDYYTRSHFDFLLTAPEGKPAMAIEYDGPFHAEPVQAERDKMKNRLCEVARFPLLRIGANHILKKFRGMTLLRWLVEVSQLEAAFDVAQSEGSVPCDEPFDPAMIAYDGRGRHWPYWLSLDANRRINKFLDSQARPTAWVTRLGVDDEKNYHALEYIKVGDNFLYVKTAARNQGAAVRIFDMLGEVAHCEMAEKLDRFLAGSEAMLALNEFKPIHDRICQTYQMLGGGTRGTGLGG